LEAGYAPARAWNFLRLLFVVAAGQTVPMSWPGIAKVRCVTAFAISLEDDAFVWATAQVEIDDEEMASVCAMQFASILFARMQDEAPDWSNCRIRLAGPNGEILVSSAADAALFERDHLRLEPLVRTDH